MSERNYYVICDNNCKFPAMTKEQVLTAIEQAVATGKITDVDSGFITRLKEMNGNEVLTMWIGTQAEYNALTEITQNCLYLITDETTEADIEQRVADCEAKTESCYLDMKKRLDAHIEVDTPDTSFISNYFAFIGSTDKNVISAALGKNNEDMMSKLGRALGMYARYQEPTIDIDTDFPALVKCDNLTELDAKAICEIVNNDTLNTLICGNSYGGAVVNQRAVNTFDNVRGDAYKTSSGAVDEEAAAKVTQTIYEIGTNGKYGAKYTLIANATLGNTNADFEVMTWQTNAFVIPNGKSAMFVRVNVGTNIFNTNLKIMINSEEAHSFTLSKENEQYFHFPVTTGENVTLYVECSTHHGSTSAGTTEKTILDFDIEFIGLE